MHRTLGRHLFLMQSHLVWREHARSVFPNFSPTSKREGELDCGSSYVPPFTFTTVRFRSPVGLRGSLVWRENEKKKGKKRKEKRGREKEKEGGKKKRKREHLFFFVSSDRIVLRLLLGLLSSWATRNCVP